MKIKARVSTDGVLSEGGPALGDLFRQSLAIWLQRIQVRPVETSEPANYQPFIFSIAIAICFWTAVWLAISCASVRLQLQIERLNALKAE